MESTRENEHDGLTVAQLTEAVESAEAAYHKISEDLRAICCAAESVETNYRARCAGLAEAKEAAEQAYRAKCAELDELRSTIDGGDADRCAELEEACRVTQESLIAKSTECGEIRAASAAAESALRARCAELESAKRAADETQRAAAAELAEARAAFQCSMATQEGLQSELESVRLASESASETIADLERRCETLQRSRDEMETSLRTLQSELESRQPEGAAADEALHDEIERLRAAVAEAEQRAAADEALHDEIERLRAAVAEAEQRADADEELHDEVERLRAAVAEAEQRADAAGQAGGGEEDREQLRHELEQALGEQTTLREALEQARADQNAVAGLVAAIASEWSGAHGAILNRIESARDAKSAKAIERATMRARSSISAFQSLMTSVSDITRLQDGSLESQAKVFEPRELVHEATALIRPQGKSNGREVVCEVAAEVPERLRGDDERLQQVLSAMLMEACRFAPDGKITLRLDGDPRDGTWSAYRFCVDGRASEASRASGPASGEGAGEQAPELPASLLVARRFVELMEGQLDVVRAGDKFAVWCTLPLELFEPGSGNRRQHARLPQDGLSCSLGTVLNLSLGGIRIRGSRVPQGLVTVTISSDFDRVDIKGEVAWSRRLGFRKYEIGIRFIAVSEQVARKLVGMASVNRYRRALE